MRRSFFAMSCLVALAFFLFCPAFTGTGKALAATTIKIIDQGGEETVLVNPKIQYREGMVLYGLKIPKGKGKVILKWQKTKKIDFPKPFQAKIILKSGKIIKTAILEDYGRGLFGKSELGSFNIRLKDVKSIEVISDKKKKTSAKKPRPARVTGPLKLPYIPPPKLPSVPAFKPPHLSPNLPGLPGGALVPKPKGDKKNYLRFINKSGRKVKLRIFNCKTKSPVEEIVVPNSSTKGTLTKNGSYYFVARYGSKEENYRYTKGKKITMNAPKGKRRIVSITLHKVKGGNYPTKKVGKNAFEGK